MPDAVNPDRNSLVYVYPGDDGPADGDTIQFNATTGRWEAVQGGASVPTDWLTARAFAVNQPIVSGAGSTFEFAESTDPDPRGSAISWDIGTPDTVTINTTGIYDVSAKLAISAVGLSPPYVCSLTEILYQGDNVGPFYDYDMFNLPITGQPFFAVFSIPGVALTVGDTLKLYAKAVGDSQIRMVEGAMTVSRRG